MKIIFGLGNPGLKYAKTRHNVGFMVVDGIKETYNFPEFEFNNKLNCEMSAGNAILRSKNRIILVKPQTFMNNSGQTARAVLDFYKLTPENIIVIHDDIDLPLGEYKIATHSGSAGHNGVTDIISEIGTKDFKRIRIGIATGDLRNPIDPADFVLQKFPKEELQKITELAEKIILNIAGLLS